MQPPAAALAPEGRSLQVNPEPSRSHPARKHFSQLNCAEGLPEAVSEEMLQDEAFLRPFHHALLEVHLEEGALVCPETGRHFKVSKGIPNMLLNEDEV